MQYALIYKTPLAKNYMCRVHMRDITSQLILDLHKLGYLVVLINNKAI
jgi:hypothetical protein